MTIQELWDQLNQHDWFYDFSDDGRSWREGHASYSRLQGLASKVSGGEEMMKAFRDHHFSGKPWNTEQQPKPERPAEISQ